MIEIFDKMMSKEFDENMLLSEAYASIKGKNSAWVYIEGDCSIKECCHRMYEKLEEDGRDLDTLGIDIIRQQFASLIFRIDYPADYLSLLKSMERAKKARATLMSYEHTTEETIAQINESIEWINKKINEFE